MKNDQRDFFDNLAASWDESRAHDEKRLAHLLAMTGIQDGDSVLDIGCGTGVLLSALKAAAGDSGSITALDFSGNMIRQAQQKHHHLTGIAYVVADILEYRPQTTFTHITCLNFYPHIQDKHLFFQRMYALLERCGSLSIMHDISRAAVNAIHGQSAVVTEDRLPPAEDLAKLFAEEGFRVATILDTEELYFVRGSKQ